MRGAHIVASIGGVAGGASVVCMASMGAMAGASTAGVSAGMAGMGAAAAATPHVPAVTRALRTVGLGALTHLPNAVLHPLLIILLLVAVGASLRRAWVVRTGHAAVLAILIAAAASGLYASIYVVVSETGYGAALAVLLAASLLSGGTGWRVGTARLP